MFAMILGSALFLGLFKGFTFSSWFGMSHSDQGSIFFSFSSSHICTLLSISVLQRTDLAEPIGVATGITSLSRASINIDLVIKEAPCLLERIVARLILKYIASPSLA
jgi:hypothetical protein